MTTTRQERIAVRVAFASLAGFVALAFCFGIVFGGISKFF